MTTVEAAKAFQLTRPVRGATGHSAADMPERYKISTHTPREGRDFPPVFVKIPAVAISTHTPREGRDIDGLSNAVWDDTNFNSHAP